MRATRTCRRPSPVVAGVVATIAAVTFTASCATDDDVGVSQSTATASGDLPAATTAPPPPATDPGKTAVDSPTSNVGQPVTGAGDQAVIDRYVSYWDARFAANSGTPDPNDPALRRYATGAQLEAVVAETEANLAAGRAFRHRANPTAFRVVTVVSRTATEVVVQECVVDDGLIIDVVTGAVVNDTVATHSVRGVLVPVDGEWRVAEATLLQRWEGVSGCALAS